MAAEPPPESARWGQFPQIAISFFRFHLPRFCRCFLHIALHFRNCRHCPNRHTRCGMFQKAFWGKTRELPHCGYPCSVKIVKNFMRSGALVVLVALVVLLASIACSQELQAK